MYSSSVRADVVKKNGDLKVTEVAKKIGEMWGKLSEKEKTSWKNAAAEQTLQNIKDFKPKK
jgi:hypothetical protein